MLLIVPIVGTQVDVRPRTVVRIRPHEVPAGLATTLTSSEEGSALGAWEAPPGGGDGRRFMLATGRESW